MKKLAVFLVLLAACSKCHPTPLTVVPAGSSDDVKVCAHLIDVGCTVGKDSSCAVALARMRAIANINTACLLAADNQTDVGACGIGCTK